MESGTQTPVSAASSDGSFKEDRRLIGGKPSSSSTRLERLHSIEDPVKANRNETPVPSTGPIQVGEEKVTYYIWFLTGMISISGLLFGLDTGIISGILVSVGTDLGHELTNGDKELITSITTAMAFVGGLGAGVTSDRFGRKWLLWAADITFMLGAILQAVAHNLPTMTAGRAIIGLGVGMASCVCPLILTELSPTHLRGRLVTINVIMITLGQVIAYAIGAAFEKSSGGWRWMAGLCAIPAGVQIVALLLLPESPRQLIVKNRLKAAKKALKRIYPFETSEQIDVKIEFLQQEALEHSRILASEPLSKRIKDMIFIGSNRRALIVAGGLQLLQQLSGFNTLMYYSATLFASIGFNNPTAVGLIVSGTNFLGTLIALKYIDIIGRRRILLYSVPGMVIGLVLAAVFFHYLTIDTGGKLDPNVDYQGVWSGLVLFAMVFYVLSYALGIGNVPWQQGELFPISYRGIGTSIATGCNWSSNLLISSTYLSLMDAITPSGAFGLYGGICFAGWVFIVFCYPNTAGLSIEDTQIIFKRDFGIKAADEMRARKAAAL